MKARFLDIVGEEKYNHEENLILKQVEEEDK